jgi:hypothetical protein
MYCPLRVSSLKKAEKLFFAASLDVEPPFIRKCLRELADRGPQVSGLSRSQRLY